MDENNQLMNSDNSRLYTMSTDFLVKVLILAAISTAVAMVNTSLWFAPVFWKFEISDSIILIGGFVLGPTAVAYMQLVKVLLSFLITGTETGGVGEIASFLMGISYSLPVAVLFQKKKDIKTAIIALVIGITSLAIIGALLNYFFIIPAFSESYGLPIDVIVGMGTSVNENITTLEELILYANVPFNVLKGSINGIISIALYNPVMKILSKIKK